MSKLNRRPEKYSFTSREVNIKVIQKRIELIRLIRQQGFKLMEAAQILDINYSTAKMIMLKYRNTGKITSFNHEEQNKDSQHVKQSQNQLTSSNVRPQSQIFQTHYEENMRYFPVEWSNSWIMPCYFFIGDFLMSNNQLYGQTVFFIFL